MSSLSQVIVKRLINLHPHPNADNLLFTELDGLPVIINKNELKEGDLVLLTPFDVITPNEDWVPEFTRGKRVRPMRLRGIFSMAVCLPLPEGFEATEGEDVTDRLGFDKWVPSEERDDVDLQNSYCGYSTSGPSGINLYKYDLESLRKYHNEFVEGETVVITEKLEGENISILYWDEKLHVKSRNRWIAEGENKWWAAVRKYDWGWLEKNPGLVACGEKYGNVNKFRYDCIAGEENIRLFDIYDSTKGQYLDWEDFYYESDFDVNQYIPVLYKGDWQGLENHKHLAEGKSLIGENIREGFVVQPIENRFSRNFQRVKYKMHGESYLIAKGKLK